LQNKFNDLVK